MTRDLLRLLAFLAAFGSALIHLAIAPEHMTEAAYIGWLFLAGGGALLLVALAALTDDTVTRTREFLAAWHLGALVCAGMIIALLASRTVGLPGGYREGWEPEAVWSLVLELSFLGAYVARLRGVRAGRWKEVASDADPFQALAADRPADRGGAGRVRDRQLALELTRRQGVPPAGAGRDRPAAPGREG